MTSRDYIEALERRIGAPAANEGGDVYALTFNERGMLLRWLEEQRAFALHFEIGALSATDRPGQCVRLLSWNFLMQETCGGALSLNPADGSIGLNLMLHADGISADEFLARLDEASRIALAWTDRVTSLQNELKERARLLMDEIAAHAASEGLEPAVDALDHVGAVGGLGAAGSLNPVDTLGSAGAGDTEMPPNMFMLRV